MFASGPISTEFAVELTKVVDLQRAGMAREVLLNELLKIDSGTYAGFGTNKNTIEVVDTPLMSVELMVSRRSDEASKETIQSVAFETCLQLVYGDVDIIEYALDEAGSIVGPGTAVRLGGEPIFMFAKTSDSRKLYDFIPQSDICMFITSTYKKNADDYYVTYDRQSLARVEAVSTSSRESRVQFWLTFYDALRDSMEDDLLAKVQADAETIKLRDFITAIREADPSHAGHHQQHAN